MPVICLDLKIQPSKISHLFLFCPSILLDCMATSPENGVKKGAWSKEEDQILIHYMGNHDLETWKTVSEQAGLNRCGKSCRLRWTNNLRPGHKRGEFSADEEATIISLHREHGNKYVSF